MTKTRAGDEQVVQAAAEQWLIYDPRAGEIRGHKQLRRFISQNQSWLAERRARIETVASTVVGGRAVVELLAHLPDDGRELAPYLSAREQGRTPAEATQAAGVYMQEVRGIVTQ